MPASRTSRNFVRGTSWTVTAATPPLHPTMSNPSNLFDQLPDETILSIIRGLDCYHGPGLNPHIWHLSSCNSRLRRVAVGPLYQSLRLIQPRHLDILLRTIIEIPEYGLLVKTLDIQIKSDAKDKNGMPRKEADMNHSASDRKASEIYVNAARGHRLPNDLTAQLALPNPWAKALFLFHLLPQLERLAITHEEFKDPSFDLFLSTLIHSQQLFPKLVSFSRYCVDPSKPYESFAVGALIPIFLCPSVTTICARRANTHYEDRSYDQRLPPNTHISSWYGISNVEKIKLVDGYIDARHLAHLLLLPRALKHLVCHQGTDDDAYAGFYDIFFEGLEHISSTLEVLDIIWASGHYGSQLTIGSLQNFRALKTLIINYSFLIGWDLKNGLPSISTLLPSGLEVLGLHAEAWSRLDFAAKLECVRMILLDKSPSCVPLLRTIGDVDNPNFLGPLVELASERNVKIELDRNNW
jgi:hypothetical protein